MSSDAHASTETSLARLALSARELAAEASHADDWMSRVNAESLRALSELAGAVTSSASSLTRNENNPRNEAVHADDLKAPILAAIGAADAALERLNDIITALGQWWGEARSNVGSLLDDSVGGIVRLREASPYARQYVVTVQAVYDMLIVRGEATLERLGQLSEKQPDEASAPHGYVSSERSTKFVGTEAIRKPHKQPSPTKKATKRTHAKKTPARKTSSRRVPHR